MQLNVLNNYASKNANLKKKRNKNDCNFINNLYKFTNNVSKKFKEWDLVW